MGIFTFSPEAGEVIKGVAVGAGVLVEVGAGVRVRVAVGEGWGIAVGSITSFNTGVGTGDAVCSAQPDRAITTNKSNRQQAAKIRVISSDLATHYNARYITTVILNGV